MKVYSVSCSECGASVFDTKVHLERLVGVAHSERIRGVRCKGFYTKLTARPGLDTGKEEEEDKG